MFDNVYYLVFKENPFTNLSYKDLKWAYLAKNGVSFTPRFCEAYRFNNFEIACLFAKANDAYIIAYDY